MMPRKQAAAPNNKADLVRKASLIALGGNIILAALKIGVGFMAGSFAVLGDGIDSSVDALLALMALLVSRIIGRPADVGHPWGHGRAETAATGVLSLVLFFAGGQLIVSSFIRLVELIRGTMASPAPPDAAALVVTLISIAGKLLLALSQDRLGKKAGSAMLRATAKNMAGDVVISAGVLVGLGLSILLHSESIDLVAAVLVGCWVIKSAVGIFLDVNKEIMDSGADKDSYESLFKAVHSVEGAMKPHRVRMRRVAGLWDIDLDIEVNPRLSVKKAHAIAEDVEEAIKAELGADNTYDIMVHVEPSGDEDTGEAYGLKEDSFS
jgi:cation diffusion facilitator family transporter